MYLKKIPVKALFYYNTASKSTQESYIAIVDYETSRIAIYIINIFEFLSHTTLVNSYLLTNSTQYIISKALTIK